MLEVHSRSGAFVYPWFHVNFEPAKRIVDLFQVVLLFSSSSPSILRVLKLQLFRHIVLSQLRWKAVTTGSSYGGADPEIADIGAQWVERRVYFEKTQPAIMRPVRRFEAVKRLVLLPRTSIDNREEIGGNIIVL